LISPAKTSQTGDPAQALLESHDFLVAAEILT
jgi:hypothetical protein